MNDVPRAVEPVKGAIVPGSAAFRRFLSREASARVGFPRLRIRESVLARSLASYLHRDRNPRFQVASAQTNMAVQFSQRFPLQNRITFCLGRHVRSDSHAGTRVASRGVPHVRQYLHLYIRGEKQFVIEHSKKSQTELHPQRDRMLLSTRTYFSSVSSLRWTLDTDRD